MASSPRQPPPEKPATSEPASPVPAPSEHGLPGPDVDDPAPETADPPQTEPVWPTT